MWWSEARRLIPLLLFALLLGACGFQLREQRPLPPLFEYTYIEAADRYSLFYQRLTMALRAGGATLVDNRADASAVLRIRSDVSDRRVLSVSARNVPRELDVYYTVRFSVEANGRTMIPLEEISISREFTWDETQVLGKQNEEEQLRAALATDLVGLLTRRLSVLGTDEAVPSVSAD